MAEEPAEQEAGKARKRSVTKATPRLAGEKIKGQKVKATLHLSAEADKRLSVHATMMDLDRSELIERLINDHLRRYVVSDRGGEILANNETAA